LHDFLTPRPQLKRSLGGYAEASAASFFAAAAGFGALLAVLHMGPVLFALVAAGLADFGTLAQQVRAVLRATSNQAGREGADIGAVAVEANTASHHFDVFFLQAGGGAVLTSSDAGVEGVEEGLVLGMHG
jgi:hypothetical protein